MTLYIHLRRAVRYIQLEVGIWCAPIAKTKTKNGKKYLLDSVVPTVLIASPFVIRYIFGVEKKKKKKQLICRSVVCAANIKYVQSLTETKTFNFRRFACENRRCSQVTIDMSLVCFGIFLHHRKREINLLIVAV